MLELYIEHRDAGVVRETNDMPEETRPLSAATTAATGPSTASSTASPTVDAWPGRPTGLPRSVPPPSIPLRYLVASALGLVACGVALVWSRRFAVVNPTDDPVVGAAHFAMLATLSMGLLGALHQFIPVITQRPLRSVRLSRGTFLSWFAGSWLLPLGFITRHEVVVEAGGALAALALVLLVTNVAPPLLVRPATTPVIGLRGAVVGFIVTACYGVVYVIDRRTVWFDLNGHVVLAHASVGLLAWLGLAYVAVSEKLWPMFLLAHVPGRHRAGWLAVRALPLGVAALSPGLLFAVPWLTWCGAAIVAIGLGAHLWSLFQHLRHRRRAADLHMAYLVTSALWLLIGATLAVSAALVIGDHHHEGVALIAAAVVAITGWLLVALVGHVHKVVPFIVWSALRGRGIATRHGAPLLFADLYGHRVAIAIFALVNGGLAAACLGFATSSTAALAIGGVLLAVTGIGATANLSWAPLRLLYDASHAVTREVDASDSSARAPSA